MDSGNDDFPELCAKRDALAGMFRALEAEIRLVESEGSRRGTCSLIASWRGTGRGRILMPVDAFIF
jgi:hypothetical protein